MTILRALTLLVLFIATLPISAQVWSMKDLKDDVRRISVSPDSTMMVASIESDLMAWTMADGKQLWRVPIDDRGAGRFIRKCFVGTTSLVVGMENKVVAVNLADGKIQDVAANFTGDVDTAFGRVMVLSADEAMLVIDTKTMKEIFRKEEVQSFRFDSASHTMYVMAPHELSVINTETAAAMSYKIEPEEIYGRARDKYFTMPGMVTLATEAGFYTYDASTGRKVSHVAHEMSDMKNYRMDTVGSSLYAMISLKDHNEIHDLSTGKQIILSPEQLPGIVDRFYGTKNGLAFAVSYDDDDSMHIGCIDVNAGTLRWARTVGWGNRTYYADPLRYPSGFVSFMLAHKGSSYYANDAERMADMHATRYNTSTRMMEPDYTKQAMAQSSGSMDRTIARTMRLMAEEARRPIPNLAKGISPRLTYADANLVSVTDKQATILIYGGIYRPTEERAEFPDGEGLLTFDLTTGASTFTHIPIYGNENTAGDFNADHMSDIRDMGNGHFCAFGDTAIIYITDKGATRVGFKTKKIALYKGTLDSMWVVDIDPETELISYLTLVYDRATGKATTRLMAQSDQPCYQVADWPTSDVAFSMIDDVLTLYPSAPVNSQSFAGLTPTYVVPSDTIEGHRYADFYDEDELTNFGIRLTNSHLVIVGRDATGIFPTKAPMCSTVIPTEEWPSKTGLHFRQHGSSILRETSTMLRIMNLSGSCTVTPTTTVELDADHRAYIVKNGVVIVDNDAKTVSLYR